MVRMLRNRSGRKDAVTAAVVETLEQRKMLASFQGAYLFYNNSAWDGNNAAINDADSAAIATDKVPLRELQKASFSNYSSYSRGINGVMVDIKSTEGTPTLADFQFKVGNANTDPFQWSAAPTPTGFSFRKGKGAGGSDRVVFTWADSAIKGKWLQVTALPTSRTGLFQKEVVYFGSAIGEVGNVANSTRVDAADELKIRSNPRSLLNPAPIDNPYDLNRDKKVDAADQLIARSNTTSFLTDLKLVTAPPVPISNLAVEYYSSSEIRLTWRQHSAVETGYSIKVTDSPTGTFKELGTVPADITGALITRLHPGATYYFKVEPILNNPPSGVMPVAAPTVTVTMPEATRSGSNFRWYNVSLPKTAITKGEAGYTGTGSASVVHALVGAESEVAAVLQAISGSATITNYNGQQRQYTIPTITLGSQVVPVSSAYKFGTVVNGQFQYQEFVNNAWTTKTAVGFGPLGTSPGGIPVANGDKILSLEDTFEWTNQDLDFDDFFWKVNISTAPANLSVVGTTEETEETIGRFVEFNANFDEDNLDRSGNPAYDYEAHLGKTNRITPADADLVPAQLSLDGTPGTWRLTFPSKVRVWRPDSNGNWIEIVSGQESTSVASPQNLDLLIEGVDVSASINDVSIRLTFTPTTGSAVEDVVKLTVSGTDLDIDSDDDDLYAYPELDRKEEKLEQNPQSQGKRLYVNDNDSDGDGIADYADGFNRDGVNGNADDQTLGEKFVPLPLLVRRPIDLSTATFTINYSASNPLSMVGAAPAAGARRVWRSNGTAPRSGQSVASGGDYVAPGTYTAAQLGIDGGRQTVLWVEAIAPTTSLAERTISVTVDPDGTGPVQSVLTDSVLVTASESAGAVGTIKGFKWNDLNENGFRDGDLLRYPPNTIYVIDVSGSTIDPFFGEDTGDVNGDGESQTILDGELQAFRNLTDHMVTTGNPDALVSIVVFGSDAAIVDFDPSTPGLQSTTVPGSALDDVLTSIQIGHLGVNEATNYEAGLQQAIKAARSLLDSGRETNVIFLSDGFPNRPDSDTSRYTDEADALRKAPYFANLRAFGAGGGASLPALKAIDPAADIFYSSTPLLGTFDGSFTELVNYSEPGIAGWTITAFQDTNGNKVLDVGESSWSAQTEDNGDYTITGLPPGTYVAKEEVRAGWTQTHPLIDGGTHTVTVVGDQVTPAIFGNHLSAEVNLVIDSDNNNEQDLPDNSAAEESAEDYYAKDIFENNADTDQDGIPGYADLQSAGTSFTPMLVDLSQFADVDGVNNGTITFNYSGSDPTLINGSFADFDHFLRIWTKNADQARSLSDYIRPGEAYSLASLGLSVSNPVVTLWVEGVATTNELADGYVKATLDIDGLGGSDLQLSDVVHARVLPNTLGSATISGQVFHDINRNKYWDKDLLVGDNPDIVFVIDISGSTESGFEGDIDDVNGDTYADRMDAEIAGFIALNKRLVDLGFGSDASISIVKFDHGAYYVPINGALSATPTSDQDGNGVWDVVDALTGIDSNRYGSTDFQPALQKTIDAFRTLGTRPGDANVFFLTDGLAYVNYEAEVGVLRGPEFDANIRAFAVSTGEQYLEVEQYTALRPMDPQATIFRSIDEVLNVFSGLASGEPPESPLNNRVVFLDRDGDNVRDTNEQYTLTDSDGTYTFTGLRGGTHHIVVERAEDWLVTTPTNFPLSVTVDDGATFEAADIGLIEDKPLPSATVAIPESVVEGTSVTVSVTAEEGYGPFRYSFDWNNDGDFIDADDVYRSSVPYGTFVPDDGPATRTIRVRIHDGVGQHVDYVVSTTVLNRSPLVKIDGLPTEIDLSDFSETELPLHFFLKGTRLDVPADELTSTWSVTKDGVAFGSSGADKDYELVLDGAGTYVVVFTTTDDDGGSESTDATIVVKDTAPKIISVAATANPVITADTRLTVTATDDGGESQLRYFWDVDHPEGIAPETWNAIGTNGAKNLDVKFLSAGTYQFAVLAVDEDGQEAFQTLTVIVEAVPTTIAVNPPYATADATTGQFDFDLIVRDQFGAIVSSYSGSPAWSITSATAIGSINASSGLYQGGTTSGVDEITVTLGTMTATARVLVQSASDYPLTGAASKYNIPAGGSIGSATNASGQGIAGFIDTLAGTSTSDYVVTVDWDIDDAATPVAATLTSFTLPGGAPAFEVHAGTHTYLNGGSYTFRVVITPTNGRDPLVLNGTVDVAAAPVLGGFVTINPPLNTEYDGLVFLFDPQNASYVASDFDAEITWESGASTSTTVPNSGTRIEKITTGSFAGFFGVFGAYTYTSAGSRTMSLKLWKTGDAVYPSGQEPTQTVNVYEVVAPVPEAAGTWQQSSSQIGVQWKKVAPTVSAGGNTYDLYGYVIWSFNKKTGERHRIPSETVISGTPTQHDPVNTLFTVDNYLPPNTDFVYTVQAVYAGPNNELIFSAESASMDGSTAPLGTVPAAVDARGTYGLSDDPEDDKYNEAVPGSTISWRAPTDLSGEQKGKPFGYRVYRKELNSASEWVWRDLFSDADLTTPATDPDFRATLTQGVDWEQTSGQNLLKRVYDPGDTGGELTWFDPFKFSTGQTQVEYAIVGFAPTSDPVPENAIAVGPATYVTIERDLTGPSAVTGLKAQSYPQALQLSWDDVSEADLADFAGWHVYKWPGTGEPTEDPNDWTRLTTGPIKDQIGYNDFGAEVGQTITYMVIAVDHLGNASAPAMVTHRRALNSEPQAPTGLSGRSNGTSGGLGNVVLSWDVVTPVQHLGHEGDLLQGYDIDRADSGAPGGWIRVRSAIDSGGDSTTVSDSGLPLMTTVTYRVRAVDQDGDYSPWSTTTASTGDGVAPATPALVSSSATGYTTTRLVWQAGSGGADATVAYRVYRSLNATNGFVLHPAYAADQTATQLDDSDLSASTTYYYRIYAIDADGDLSATPLAVTQATQTLTEARRPIVRITSPGIGQTPLELTADTSVRGIIDDENNNLTGWSLVLRPLTPAGQQADIVVASGESEMGQAPTFDVELGSIRATQLANGIYQLVVKTIEDDGSAVGLQDEVTIGLVRIKTDVKVGNFTLPVTDLEVETASGQSIQVTRVYDSSKASENGDFGYGWRLEVLDTQLRTTETASGRSNDETTIRYGDVVYITIPGRGEHAFQFVPKPLDYTNGIKSPIRAYDPTHWVYASSSYEAQFVSVDGSGATLTVPGYVGHLKYDRGNKTFYGDLNNQSFNPKAKAFGGKYLLTTTDGEKYEVNAETGDLISSEDSNGNKLLYNDKSISGGSQGITIHRDSHGRVDWISTDPKGLKGQTVRYEYSPFVYDNGEIVGGGDLIKVTDPTGRTTEFEYTDGEWDPPVTFEPEHLLTKMIDPRGLEVVKVVYDENGKLVRVDDVRNKKAQLGYGAFNGQTGSTSSTDLLGNTTEQVYNERGDVIRSIEAIRSGTTIVKYIVTVHDFAYYTTETTGSLKDMVLTGKSHYNRLKSQSDWQSFEIPANDPTGMRYSVHPGDMGAKVAREVTYHIKEDQTDPDNGNLASERVLLTDGVNYRTTTYADYVLGRPSLITDELTGAVTTNVYDDVTGNLIRTQNALGETTFYSYSNKQSYQYKMDGQTVDLAALPKGLLLETWVERPAGPGGGSAEIAVLSANRYYGTNSTARNFGRLESTQDASGHRTFYSYDEFGRAYLTWYRADDAVHGTVRIETETKYDAAGRETSMIDGRVTRVSDGVVLDAGLTTSTFYDEVGQTLVTVDAHGEETVSTYDARGNLVRTLYPDATETRTVYDDMGRVVWVSDRFASTSAYSFNQSTGELVWASQDSTATYVATHNLYDSLGRLVATERYKNVSLGIAADLADGLYTTSAPDAGTIIPANLVATTSTVYDERGRVVETVAASGLRSGNVYYPNGQLHYSGPLLDSAPASWYTQSTPMDYFQVDPLTDSPLVMTHTYDLTDNLPTGTVIYDKTTDANGLITRTYKDVLGRVVLTVQDPGTPTNASDDITSSMVYGIDGAPAAGTTLPTAGEGWTGIPVGGRHVVKIDPRGLETHELYDKAGRLTDIWLPAVDDGSVAGIALVRPHWQYTYDTRGNQLTQVDPKDHETSFDYDVKNRRVSRTLPADSDSDTTNDTETWTYDHFGRMKTHTDFKRQVTEYVYDDESLTLIGGGTNDGLTLSATRPELGRLIEERRYANAAAYASGTIAETTRYGYDELGRRAAVGEYAGATDATPDRLTKYDYDDVTGGVIQMSSPEGTINHQYDQRTGRLIRTWTSHTETAYGYDELGRLEHVYAVVVSGVRAATFDYYDDVTYEPVFTGGTPSKTIYTYTAVGSLDTVTEDNGTASVSDDLIHDYTYDEFNRLETAVVKQGDGDLLLQQTFDLRVDGQRNSVLEKRYNGTSSTPFSTVTVSWEYDDNGRLTKETREENGNAFIDTGTEYQDIYAFDLNGNRVYKAHDGVGTGPANDSVIVSDYNDRDQLRHTGVDDNANGLFDTAETDTTYDYDVNGSTIAETTGGETKRYQWDLRNRMVGFDVNGDGDTADAGDYRFAYDHDGVRVGKTREGGPSNPDQVTTYLQDTNNPTGYSQVLEERVDGSLVRGYVIGNDVIAQADGSTVRRFLYDGGGHVRGLVDATGQPVSTEIYAYDAFGNRIDLTNPVEPISQLLYRGELYDPTLGQYVLRARFYDASRGTFTRFDTFEGDTQAPLGLHKYAYANGNAIMYADPSGEVSLLSTIVQAGIRSGLMGLAIGVPFRAIQAGRDIYNGASLRSVALDFVIGAATDFALGAVLGGGAAGIVRQFASNAFKVRAVGQSIFKFISARVPWSVWRMGASARGFAIEKAVLNRTAAFLGRQIKNFPVIDDYIIKGGRGIATSVKSLDLTAKTYQTASNVVSRLNRYARTLQSFRGAVRPTFQVGMGTANAIDDKVLVVVMEEGAATSTQASAIVNWLREAKSAFPDVKVVLQFVP